MKTMMKIMLTISLLATAGCQQAVVGSKDSNLTPTGKQYLLATEPVDSVPVGQARNNARDGEKITLVGHIGGSPEPFVDGIAAFAIVDPKVAYCAPEEGCPTPWDYCCTQDEVKENIATIKVVNEQGLPVTQDAQRLLGVKELSLVVVQGIAKRDEQGNLSVLATQVFVKN